MAKIDKTYHEILRAIKDTGYIYRTENRPDVEMKQISSINFEHSLMEFPAITTKEVFFKAVMAELIWFLRGDANIKYLVDNGVNIWNEDAYNWYKKHYAEHVAEGKAATQNMFTLEGFVSRIKEDGNLQRFQGMDYMLGHVGANYGVQWRQWNGLATEETYHDNFFVDQISQLIYNLRKPNPISRRHIVTAWNPAEIDQTALPPCHWSFEILPRPMSNRQKMIYSGQDMEYLESLWDQAHVRNDKEAEALLKRELANVPEYGFTLKWHQRSVDTFLGLPFNIASYAALAHIIGALTGMIPLSIIGDLSNVHIYGNHWDAVNKQLSNSPIAFEAPKLKVSDRFNQMASNFRQGSTSFEAFIQSMNWDDMWLESYNNFGKIGAKMVAPVK